MLTLRRTLALGLVLAVTGCDSITDSQLADPGEAALHVMGTRAFTVDLQPLNSSGVSGTASLFWDGEELTVTMHATGLEADRTHAQHIHGNPPARGIPSNSTCPTMAADANGDGIVSVGEGFPNYGPVLRALTPFTTAPGGVIDFSATYSGAELAALGNLATLQTRTIVVHGLSIDGSYVGSTPVACGQITPAPRGR